MGAARVPLGRSSGPIRLCLFVQAPLWLGSCAVPVPLGRHLSLAQTPRRERSSSAQVPLRQRSSGARKEPDLSYDGPGTSLKTWAQQRRYFVPKGRVGIKRAVMLLPRALGRRIIRGKQWYAMAVVFA